MFNYFISMFTIGVLLCAVIGVGLLIDKAF